MFREVVFSPCTETLVSEDFALAMMLVSNRRYSTPTANIRAPPYILASWLAVLTNGRTATYMRSRFSALFAGRVVKTLISTHESIQLATVKTFFRMNSKP
jgi:hypothetical protein